VLVTWMIIGGSLTPLDPLEGMRAVRRCAMAGAVTTTHL